MERLAAFGGGGPRGIIPQPAVPLPKEATLMDEEIQELVSLAQDNSMDTSTTSTNLDIDGEKTLKRKESNKTLAKAFFPSRMFPVSPPWFTSGAYTPIFSDYFRHIDFQYQIIEKAVSPSRSYHITDEYEILPSNQDDS